jgi:uncharacterized membrane protein
MPAERASIDIAAPASTVWSTWIDVERCPEWTAAVRSMTVLDARPLHVGSKVRVQLRRLPPAVWHVDALEQDRLFVWSARNLGVMTVVSHEIVPGQGSHVTAVLTLDSSGWLAPAVAALTRSLIRRYLDLEVRGLKARCESRDEGRQ